MKRLTAYPGLRVHLDKLQPKVFALSSDADATPVKVEAGELGVAADIERINKSRFTNKGDKGKVISLYETYARNTVGALTRTLESLLMASHSALQRDDTEVDNETPENPYLTLERGLREALLREAGPSDTSGSSPSS